MKEIFTVNTDWKKNVYTFFLMFLIGCGLLVLVNCIPTEYVRKHVISSSNKIVENGDYPYMGIEDVPHALDNWTESMLLNSYYIADSSHPVYSAFIFKVYQPDELSGTERLHMLLSDSDWRNSEYLIERSSYWMGYTVFLRPLMSIMDYESCRDILNIVSFTLLIICISLISKSVGNWMAISLGITFTIFHYYILSLQYSLGIFCVFISMAAIIFLLYNKKKLDYVHFFLMIGITTAYFEWFSIPLITFGLPLVVGIYLEDQKDRIQVKAALNIIFKSSIGWCLGYGLMIIFKNIAAMFVLGGSSWRYFHERFISDIGSSITLKGFLAGFYHLLDCIFPFSFLEIGVELIVLTFIIIFGAIIILRYQEYRGANIAYGIIFFSPIIWYLMFYGHIGHSGIDYRTLMISCFSYLMILRTVVAEHRVKRSSKKI